MTELSELFLVDADNRNAELQRFAAGARGASLVHAAGAAGELADLLRSFGLAPHARCARALALALPRVEAGHIATDPGEWRLLVTALSAEVADVTDRLRRQTTIADPAGFADRWLAHLDRLTLPSAPAVPVAPRLPVPVSGQGRESGADTQLPLHALRVAVGLAPDAALAEAQRRHTALQQARLLHESLPQTVGAARAGVERVIADLVLQARSSLSVLAGWPLPSPLGGAAEALHALGSALALLPSPPALKAWSAEYVLGVDLTGTDAASAPAQAAAQVVVGVGGRAEALPDGLRLLVPRDPCRPRVVVWRGAQGWFAVPALQAAAAPHPWAPAAPTEDATSAWRYDLPAADLWSRPTDWRALVSDASGRVMPLLRAADRSPPASEGSP